jgi:hypothetical protein
MSLPSDFSLLEAFVGTPEFGPALQSSVSYWISDHSASSFHHVDG